MAKLVQPLKFHGGKHYLAPKIIALMPKHLHYVEPYFGGGTVLLEKAPYDEAKFFGEKNHEQGVSEIVNDINGHLTNFWRVLQDPKAFAEFLRIVQAVPFSEVEWIEADAKQRPTKELDVEAAVAFFVRCRQSRAGKLDCFATLSRNRTRRGMNEQVSAWLTCVEGLPAVHARLKRVVILNRDAFDVIQEQDGPKSLFYLDPPYLHETRVSIDDYEYEMTLEQHRKLLAVIKQCKDMVLLSGYPNKLYNRELADWNREDFRIDNKASAATTKPIMTERVWMNY